jgi:hypothetical protein
MVYIICNLYIELKLCINEDKVGGHALFSYRMVKKLMLYSEESVYGAV